MGKKIVLSLIICMVFHSYAMANDPLPPQLISWKEVNHQNIDIRVSDKENVFLALEVEYINPLDDKEHILVVCKFISFNSIKGQTLNPAAAVIESDRRTYQEKEVLEKSYGHCDNIIYIRYKLKSDPKTKEMILESFESWLLDNTGEFIYKFKEAISEDDFEKTIGREDFFEPTKTNPNKNIIVGRKYTLNGSYHIIRADPRLLLANRPEEK